MDIKEQWQQTPLWQKVILLVFISGLISYLVYISLILPKKDQKEALVAEVENMRNELEIIKQSIDPALIEKLNKKIEEIRAQNEEKIKKIESFQRAIPTQPEIEEVLSFVSTSAKRSFLVINNFQVEKDEEVNLYYDRKEDKLKIFQQDEKNKTELLEDIVKLRRIVVQSSIYGDMNRLFPFLEDFSRSQRIVNIDGLEIKKEVNKLNYILTLSVYYTPEGH